LQSYYKPLHFPLLTSPKHNTFVCSSSYRVKQQQQKPVKCLQMGFLDDISSFLSERDGDFVKLEKTQSSFGPGPALLLYKVSLGIDDDEVYEILENGALKVFEEGIVLQRIQTSADGLLGLEVRSALQQVVAKQQKKIHHHHHKEKKLHVARQ